MSVNGHSPNGAGAHYDALVVGGGHNALTAAAYLAKAGLRVCVLERRPLLGGACVTEELWPGQRVSRASYVVSMLQPKIVADLELTRYGYHPIPLDPEFATFAADGSPILLPNDKRITYEQVARVSRKDAEALEGFDRLFDTAGEFLRPLMLRPPPALGSRRPTDVFELLREAGRAAGLSRRDLTEIFRLMTMSVGDLLDDHFETDELKGAYASSGVVGVWAGPYTPGTAYNLLHHALGEVGGVKGAWGHVRGGMGAISEAIAASARASGATIRTDAEVASIDVAGGRVRGVTLADGEQLTAPLVLSGAHPRRTVLDLVGAEHFPSEVADDMRRYRTRGASVKINAVLSEPPRYVNAPPDVAEQLLHASVAICPSVPYLERAWQDAQRGVPAEGPYIEVEVPTAVDPTLTDDGTTVVTMFTQFGPWNEEGWKDGAREAYAERCFALLAQHAPNVPGAILHYEVLAPPDLEHIFGLEGGSIFQGEQGLDQMAFMRPTPELSRYGTPVHGLYLCGAGTHPGGGVIGASGHNAAHVVLRDARRERTAARLRRPRRAPATA
ncbi:MAG TPA: NAD(P)/FAD-dependent oxidoreductase [Solirubrobacteraceae bacterium]|nr:NAD(P)/FAD-dependent oxidoreductase [Solirubrobacteraceae bacterium]